MTLTMLISSLPKRCLSKNKLTWLASRPDQAILWSQAGGSSKAEVYGRWWASIPPRERRKRRGFMMEREAILKKWDAVWGDRQHELVVIGLEMDQSVVRKQLEACLLTPDEIDQFQKGHTFADNRPL
jgi:G3E family GTPase